eukprot:TRINITY_DN14235_c0_g1_i1.p2 TRINITY_DN14235_c0_g1~~TRINITY_DN14235_c0_g1_i1.p2  ORF type:complete len:152 (-),score=35.09 TRINITY_DN14235_c0_g1_i1:463-918(-)
MVNGVDFGQENSFMETIKERLLKERELLEKRIESKKSMIDSNFREYQANKKLRSFSHNRDRSKISQRNHMPSYGNPQLSLLKTAAKFTEAKEYEKTLENVGRNILNSAQAEEEKNNAWHIFSDIGTLKRKIDTMNTNKFLEFQIRENVSCV